MPSGRAANGDASPDAVGAAVAFIVRSTQQRPQTEAEVRARLAGRGLHEEVLEAALARAREIGAVDDALFARAWVEDRGRARGYGASRLRAELRRRLVPEPILQDALAALEGRDDEAIAAELARARLGQLPARLRPEVAARRLTGYLVRRGYAPGLAERVAIDVCGIHRDWD